MVFTDVRSVSNVNFTEREIDVISCILNARGVKKIAIILSISPRTVEGYVQNILFKISANSQEQIRDFVEKSNELRQINERYSDLIAAKFLKEQMHKISSLIKDTKKLYVLKKRNGILDFIIKYIKLANVEVVLQDSIFYISQIDDQYVLLTLEEDLPECKNLKNLTA